MEEKIYRIEGDKLAELTARDPGRRYKYRTDPSGENVYVEFTQAEEASRDAEEAKHAEDAEKPIPKSLEERVTEVEARLTVLEKR